MNDQPREPPMPDAGDDEADAAGDGVPGADERRWYQVCDWLMFAWMAVFLPLVGLGSERLAAGDDGCRVVVACLAAPMILPVGAAVVAASLAERIVTGSVPGLWNIAPPFLLAGLAVFLPLYWLQWRIARCQSYWAYRRFGCLGLAGLGVAAPLLAFLFGWPSDSLDPPDDHERTTPRPPRPPRTRRSHPRLRR